MPDTIQGRAWEDWHIDVAVLSDPGLKRPINEDAFLCDPERGLFLVCDGIGGAPSGDLASHVAVTLLDQALAIEHLKTATLQGNTGITTLFNKSMSDVNTSILSLAQDPPDRKGGGATVVAGLLFHKKIYVANLGDSRAYLIRHGRAQVLSHDHTVAAVMEERGQIEAGEAKKHPLKHCLSAWLGISPYSNPHQLFASLQSGDQILLCSDGLWGMLDDQEIAHLLARPQSSTKAVSSLIQAANARGGRDNITALLVRLCE